MKKVVALMLISGFVAVGAQAANEGRIKEDKAPTTFDCKNLIAEVSAGVKSSSKIDESNAPMSTPVNKDATSGQ